jgi:DNA mismatch repair protein MutS
MTTPMMQQYQEAKARHPGMLLLFRMGDFYELFQEDAELISRVLGLTLTTRDGSIPMAGFPHKALETHLHNLLRAGHRVAICDQVEDPALAKGLVRREVTRVVTPGTLTDDALLDPRQANHLAVLTSSAPGHKVGLAWIDLSTGLFHAAELTPQRLVDELHRLAPAEVLVAEKVLAHLPGTPLESVRAYLPQLTITARPDWTFDLESARTRLLEHFQVSTMAGFGFDDASPGLAAAGALLLYLQETQKSSLAHLSRLRPYAHDSFLHLDEVTRRSLELTRTLRDGEREGSLLSVLDRTVTPMGARLLADCVLTPLADKAAIERRLDAVTELLDDASLRADLRSSLGNASDLQRLTARVSTGRASPRDLAMVGKTLALLPRIKARITARRSALLRDLESRLELCADLREMLESALSDNPPLNPRDGNVIKRGYDRDLDEMYLVASTGKEWMTQFQAAEITKTGIPSLKVGFNEVHGYYIEVTHTHVNRIPANYQRRQTLKNAERYITPELKEYEERVLGAEDKIIVREAELFTQVRERVAAQTTRVLHTAEVLAWLDVLTGLAELAAERNYCRPTILDEPVLQIDEGRHPVLDQNLPPGTVVPNNIKLGPDDGLFLLITGPNMGGKSVYLRQAALLTLMAQMGSFLPARRATVGLTDRIFTRMGASDELSRAQSTFMVEMTEAANILNNATLRSLVILDEIGRGTSTYDGVSLAWGITEYLHDTIGCRTLFATHYHELAELAERLTRFRNYNAQVHEGPEGITFLHRIVPGSADKSYGIHVAQRAGIPHEVLERARQVLAELETHHLNAPDRPGARLRRPRVIQASLFANSDDPVLEALRSLDMTALTPEEVVAHVRRWQADLQ